VNDSILPSLDRKSVRAAFARAAARYDAAAVLQREIADRLLARLDYMRIAPQRAIHFGGETRQCVEQHVALQPVQDALPLALARHQAGGRENREVPRHRRRAHREARGEVGGGQGGLREKGDDLPPRHRGERVEDAIEVANH